ncbi:MAG: DDE-type integrase/transposase/recombinase [Candidatus Reddybacter sp.]
MDLHTITKRKFKHATDSAHDKAISPSLLNQIFSMSTPDAVWVGDITYIRLGQKLFILPSSLLVARCSCKAIGLAMDKRMKSCLVCVALKMVLRSRDYPKGVIVRSDGGSQHCSKYYQ